MTHVSVKRQVARHQQKLPECMEREIGFYVVCTDRMMLDNINGLMKKRGYVGIADMAGRIHYLVDGRAGAHRAAHRIATFAEEEMDAPYCSPAMLLEAAEKVVLRHKMDRGLMGTRILRYCLICCLEDASLLAGVTKRLYPKAGKAFRMKESQIERNIRYAIRHTDLYRAGHRNVYIIRYMYDEALRWLSKKAIGA